MTVLSSPPCCRGGVIKVAPICQGGAGGGWVANRAAPFGYVPTPNPSLRAGRGAGLRS